MMSVCPIVFLLKSKRVYRIVSKLNKMSFGNKVVVITGGSTGIGAATAIMFTKEDAKVVIVGRNVNNLEEIANKCEEHGNRPLIIKADISNEDDAKSIIIKTIEQFKRLDIVVNSAANYCDGTVLDGNLLKAFDEVLKVNIRAIVQLTNLAVPHLSESKGNIVNISSVPVLSSIAFSVSKACLDHFTRCAALDLAQFGIRVNAINPGYVKTDTLLAEVGEDWNMLDDFKNLSALRKLAEPEEIAEVVKLLASDKAACVTGSNYVIDNGYLLKMPS